MATPMTITNGVVEYEDDWNNPTIQVYTTVTNDKVKAHVVVKATLADTPTDDDWAVVSAIPVNSGTYVFKVNNTTEGVKYTLVGENCTITSALYQNE